MKTATMEKDDHARQNAAAWASNIAEMVAALNCDYDRLEELTDENENLKSDVENNEPENDIRIAQEKWAEWTRENGDELRELTDAATLDGELCKDSDAARERIQESPLSIEVRGPWQTPGADREPPEEFKVLLTTGGPAAQIRGELDEHGQPTRAWLEYQDWGTGWTQYFDVEQDTLLAFCSVFYFGE